MTLLHRLISWVPSGATGRAASARLVLLLAAGIAVRIALVPITRGQDFDVWDLASTATLQGSDIYTHHPAYPGGPYAYFPLFLYLELPFQFLAAHTGISFTVLGKVPILAGDVACALVLAAELRDRTASNRAVLLGTSLFFLNPLVLYNGAFYGRFDTVALALLLFSRAALAEKETVGRTVVWTCGRREDISGVRAAGHRSLRARPPDMDRDNVDERSFGAVGALPTVLARDAVRHRRLRRRQSPGRAVLANAFPRHHEYRERCGSSAMCCWPCI